MRRISWLFIVLLAAAPASAQIFPKADKDKIAEDIERAKREGSNPAPTPDQPKDPGEVKPAVKTVDGAAALARFKELREAYDKQKGAELKEAGRTISLVNPALAAFLTAHTALKLGDYKEAAKLFKKLDIPTDEEVKSARAEGRDALIGLQNGRQYFYRLVAEVMQHFTATANDADYEKAWTRAHKAGEAVITDLERAIANRRFEETLGNIQKRRLDNWLKEEKNHWDRLRAAEKRLSEAPDELGSWQAFIDLVGSQGRDEVTPHYLDARAALNVIKEFWVQDSAVRRGFVDAALGGNFTAVWQFDRGLAAMVPHDGLDSDGKRYLEEQRRKVQDIQTALLRVLGK